MISKRPKGARKEHPLNTTPSDGVRVTSGFFQAKDKTRLYYSIEGEGDPLIFCYGLVCSSLHWTYQIEYFRKNYQCIWFDYRGHQNSETPKNLSSLNIDTLAEDLNSLFEHLGLNSAIVLGHSMGVNVAIEFHRKYPNKVKKLVLANGAPRRPLDTLFNSNWFELGFKALKQAHRYAPNLLKKIWSITNNEWTQTLITWGGFNPYLTPREDVKKYIDQISAMDPEILIRLSQDYESYDATAWLPKIQCPTLILAGENDGLVSKEHQELMNQLIPNSILCVIPRGSHCPQMDMPWYVNPILEKFISTSSVH
jgi:pimeloyl-ACP methyl ester carboxylesterase